LGDSDIAIYRTYVDFVTPASAARPCRVRLHAIVMFHL